MRLWFAGDIYRDIHVFWLIKHHIHITVMGVSIFWVRFGCWYKEIEASAEVWKLRTAVLWAAAIAFSRLGDRSICIMQSDRQRVNVERTRFPARGLRDYRLHTFSLETDVVCMQHVCDRQWSHGSEGRRGEGGNFPRNFSLSENFLPNVQNLELKMAHFGTREKFTFWAPIIF